MFLEFYVSKLAKKNDIRLCRSKNIFHTIRNSGNIRIFEDMKDRIKEILDLDNSLTNVEIFERHISLEHLLDNCLAEERCFEACQACPNFGRLWTCPPFQNKIYESYKSIDIIVSRIPTLKGAPLARTLQECYGPVKEIAHNVLLEYETVLQGMALSFAGSCSFCKDQACSRIDNKPCRHPELARKSLEGVGFDIGKILETYFGLELEWGKEDDVPEFLTFVGGVMY